MSLFTELKRRNVIRMAVLYLGAAWLVMQVIDLLIDRGPLPESLGPVILIVLAIGLPIALLLAWFYEVTPEGILPDEAAVAQEGTAPTTGRSMDFVVIAVMAAALLLFAYDKWWTSPPSEQSIAVLPFANLSDDPKQEYFSDGLAEEILNLLAKIPELRVISRSSAFSFKGQNLNVPTIAARLNVAHVLEGSVRKSGDQLRVTAQLIEVETDTHLWSETYDRELKDVFAIQDDIAAAVVGALKITLLSETPKTAETDPEAYSLYLQGLHFNNLGTRETFEQAENLLKQALAIDPDYAPAWTELSYVYERQAMRVATLPVDEGSELARRASQKALAIDPQNGRALAHLARVEAFYDWDFATAAQRFQEALALNPRDASIVLSTAELYLTLGRLDEAIDLYRQAVALDPLLPVGHYSLGMMYRIAGRLDEAADSIQTALLLSPGYVPGQMGLGLVLLAQGDAPAALLAMEQETSHGFRLEGTAIVQHELGETGASDAALRELIECCAAVGAYNIAGVYAFRGEIDNAFDWLEQAWDTRDGGLMLILLDSKFASLHDDPRWEPFMNQLGLLPYWQEMEQS